MVAVAQTASMAKTQFWDLIRADDMLDYASCNIEVVSQEREGRQWVDG